MTQQKVQNIPKDFLSLEYEIDKKSIKQEEVSSVYIDTVTGEEKKATRTQLSFEAYVAVFNNVDKQNEVIKPYAFDNALKSIDKIYALFQHCLPYDEKNVFNIIGVHTNLVADSYGLKTTCKLYSFSEGQKFIIQLVLNGDLTKFSIGMLVKKTSIDEVTKVRYIEEAIPVEGSLVLMPANDKAGIIKAENIEPMLKVKSYNEIPKELATKFDNQNKQDKIEVITNNNIKVKNMDFKEVVKSFDDLKTIEKYLREKLDISQIEARTLISKIKFFGDIDLKGFVEEKLEEFKESMENTFNEKFVKLNTKDDKQDNQPTDEVQESVEVKSNQCDVDYDDIFAKAFMEALSKKNQ